jgi:hypothetical protein
MSPSFGAPASDLRDGKLTLEASEKAVTELT